MLVRRLGLGASLVLAGSVPAGVPCVAQQGGAASAVARPSFWHAASGIMAVNAVTWSYNWYVNRWHWANVGTRIWWENFHRGFAWDDDDFMANQLAHPYHGSHYFNSARASGYDFWESVPFVAAGSLSWELLLENVRPSLNDIINTTLGGISLGEVTYRFTQVLRSRSRSRSTGVSRDAAAFLLSPLVGVQELAGRRQRGYTGSQPVVTMWAAGQEAAGASFSAMTMDRTFMELAADYGDQFDAPAPRPYDAFRFRLQLSPNSKGLVTHLAISGLLARQDLSHSSQSRVALGLFHHYEYDDAPRFRFGGQSVSGAVLLRRELGRRAQVEFGFHLEGLLLASISSDHGHVRRRDYDYGPGAGARFAGSLRHDGRELVRLDARLVWLRSVYGSDADHLASFARAGVTVPITGVIGIGGELGIITRESWYPGQPSVTSRVPEARAYLRWQP